MKLPLTEPWREAMCCALIYRLLEVDQDTSR